MPSGLLMRSRQFSTLPSGSHIDVPRCAPANACFAPNAHPLPNRLLERYPDLTASSRGTSLAFPAVGGSLSVSIQAMPAAATQIAAATQNTVV